MKQETIKPDYRDRTFHLLALCLLANDRVAELTEFVGAGEIHPHYPYYLAIHLAKQGKFGAALENLRPLVAQGHQPSQYLAFKLLISQAGHHLQCQEHEELLQVLDEAMRLMPDDVALLAELEHFQEILPFCYLKVGKRQEAATLWRQKLWHGDLEALHRLALLNYWWTRRREEAYSRGEGGDLEEMETLWRQTIAYWVALASADLFWADWAQGRGKVYGNAISEEEIRNLKKYLMDHFLPEFCQTFIDSYNQEGKIAQTERPRRYLTLVRLEKRAAGLWQKILPRMTKVQERLGLTLTLGVALGELVRALQKAEGHQPCFFSEPREACSLCLWADLCQQSPSSQESRVFLEFLGGPLISLDLNLRHVVGQVLDLHLTYQKDDDEAEILADYLAPWGLATIFLEDKRTEEVFKELDRLSPADKGAPAVCYLRAAAWEQLGQQQLETKGLEPALKAWEQAKKGIQELKRENSPLLYRRTLALEEKLSQGVAQGCTKEARALHKEGQTEEAICLLKRGLEISSQEQLKNQLADIYCDRAWVHMGKKDYTQARREFEQALAVKPNFLRAKGGMGTSYNNEGVRHHDAGRFDEAISLQRRALEYSPNNPTSRQNLAGSLHAKGGKIIEKELKSAYTRYEKIAVLKKVLDLLKEAHEYDPNNEHVIRDHNEILRILRTA
jgi:tetratricopeptide (TPR) repeat protein